MCLNETYSKVITNKHLSDTFCVQNGLKCFITTSLEYAIRRVQDNQVGLKLNGTHQLLVYCYFIVIVNILRDNITTTKKNTALMDGSKEVGLEINTEKTKYMLMSHHHNAGRI
jgi:hypothetical protein